MKIEKVKVWAVIEGPYNLQTLSINYPYEIPPDCNHLVVCKVEKKKKLVDKEFWFEKDAYRFKSHIDSKMEATIIFAPELEESLDFGIEFEDE